MKLQRLVYLTSGYQNFHRHFRLTGTTILFTTWKYGYATTYFTPLKHSFNNCIHFIVLFEPCEFEMTLEASGYEYGLSSKMAIQIVNPVSNTSDEDIILFDLGGSKSYSVRMDAIQFPIVSSSSTVKMRYTRSYGTPKLAILILFLDAQEYLDRFVHIYQSVIEDNQYGVSSVHYSNFSYEDGTLSNRWNNEKLWFQKFFLQVNFTRNSEAVMWISAPQHEVLPGTPISEITYHLDNCSVVFNRGAVIETHRDLFASANMTENRFEANENFRLLLDGYYAFANISSNNFTENFSKPGFGILEVRGMEKHLVMERNRFLINWGNWMVRLDIASQSLRNVVVPAYIQYNYFLHNHYIKANEDYVDMWPRSYAVGIFGSQKAEIHFNQFKNDLLDFELISGCKNLFQPVNRKFNCIIQGAPKDLIRMQIA
uniref:SRCR domain-containing protein n=1 Tax=Heterorhabditis bacteriophora TaxID=37862 RepID=A0A1I7XK75_HETBA